MPLIYKIPGYVGNGLLLLMALIVLFKGPLVMGIFLGVVGGLNLFLVYKLDQFSQQEVWLAHQIHVAKLEEELIVERQRLSELQKTQSHEAE